MDNMKIKVTYIEGGKEQYSCAAESSCYKLNYDVTDKYIKASITPKKEITLVRVDFTFDYDFVPADRFFSNGYQSWTTSREYSMTDSMKDITPIAKVNALKELAGISADYRFAETFTEPGKFNSHCYTYVKRDGKIFFLGSLTERQGFTVFYADMNNDKLTVSKDVEGVTIKNDAYDLFDIVILKGEYDKVFDKYFKAMKVKKPRIKHMSGYTSWYNYFQKIDAKIILRDLNAMDRIKDSVSIFQIDDGYETFVGDWLDLNSEKFPMGMGKIADAVHEKGYMAGIWLAPFNLQRASRTYKEHKDWVIKDKKGRPLLGCAGWGGAYTMDIYNEEARAYIRHFFDVILNEWGYDMVKLDFLYSQCMYPRNNKSRGTIMCEAMEFLRECCGDKLILGCGVPLGAAFGYVDACRISCDVDLKYAGKFYNRMNLNNEIPSAQNAINNSVFRRHLNGRVFVNDPDVLFLRYSNLEFTYDQKLLLAAVNHIFGDVLFVSDNAEEYKERDIEVAKKAFAESDIKVIDANYVEGTYIEIRFVKDEKESVLRFNIANGESNVREVLDF